MRSEDGERHHYTKLTNEILSFRTIRSTLHTKKKSNYDNIDSGDRSDNDDDIMMMMIVVKIIIILRLKMILIIMMIIIIILLIIVLCRFSTSCRWAFGILLWEIVTFGK